MIAFGISIFNSTIASPGSFTVAEVTPVSPVVLFLLWLRVMPFMQYVDFTVLLKLLSRDEIVEIKPQIFFRGK
jgi:hypothetical protein